MLVELTASKKSGYVKKLYGESRSKRYHIDDMMLYKERQPFRQHTSTGETVEILQTDHGTHPAVIGGHGTGDPGSQAVFLLKRYCC